MSIFQASLYSHQEQPSIESLTVIPHAPREGGSYLLHAMRIVLMYESHRPHAGPWMQVLNLGRQLYIWVSTSGEMNNLALAMPTAAQSSAVPPSTQLLQGKGADAAQGVARRLTLRCRQPVAVSWNIEGDELLHLWAEKELVSELKVLDLVAQSDGLSVS